MKVRQRAVSEIVGQERDGLGETISKKERKREKERARERERESERKRKREG